LINEYLRIRTFVGRYEGTSERLCNETAAICGQALPGSAVVPCLVQPHLPTNLQHDGVVGEVGLFLLADEEFAARAKEFGDGGLMLITVDNGANFHVEICCQPFGHGHAHTWPALVGLKPVFITPKERILNKHHGPIHAFLSFLTAAFGDTTTGRRSLVVHLPEPPRNPLLANGRPSPAYLWHTPLPSDPCLPCAGTNNWFAWLSDFLSTPGSLPPPHGRKPFLRRPFGRSSAMLVRPFSFFFFLMIFFLYCSTPFVGCERFPGLDWGE
jgi:hypothetical protein